MTKAKQETDNTNCTSCYGCRGCDGCYGCYGCYGCDGCDGCRGCRGCRGCDGCRGCRGCDGCYGCYGCRGCDGCYYSFGLSECKAVYKSLFSKGLFGDKFKLFNKETTEQRIDEIREKLNSFNWYPKQTNAFELYVQNGSQWEKIDPTKLTFKAWDDSWKDAPKEMLAYIASLPEFDRDLFQQITGIDVSSPDETLTIQGKKFRKVDVEKALNSITPLAS